SSGLENGRIRISSTCCMELASYSYSAILLTPRLFVEGREKLTDTAFDLRIFGWVNCVHDFSVEVCFCDKRLSTAEWCGQSIRRNALSRGAGYGRGRDFDRSPLCRSSPH